MSNQGHTSAYLEILKKYAPRFEAVMLKHGKREEAEELNHAFSSQGAEYADLILDPLWSDLLLEDLEMAATSYRGMKGKIQAYRILMKRPDLALCTSIEALYNALVKYLTTDVIDGWIYCTNEHDNTTEAYVIHSVLFFAERVTKYGRDVHRDPPYVKMEIKANSAACGEHYTYQGVETRTINFGEEDLGKSIPEILFEEKLQKENPQLKAEYLELEARFAKFQPQFSEQFWASGKVWPATDGRYGRRHVGMWSLGDRPAKVVNDETLLKRRITTHCNPTAWRDQAVGKGFDRIPLHPYVFCFDLERHENCWVPVSNMDPYVYDMTLREKIVLPPAHRDIIEILTTDLDIFAEVGDVVKGKSGGTSILCIGKPGLGKTLTAEVYGEIRQRPLYKVHSGQLGTTGQTVESNLEIVLKRAERWNAVLLIDEADVFIRKRGDDVEHNAIVAAFLRTLEYFHGLLFMTTNREDDVDDAIISRMIAILKYDMPSKEESEKIWRIMATEFKVALSDQTIRELAGNMPITGRDIKMMIKLTARYAERKKISLNYEAFRICGAFRGMI